MRRLRIPGLGALLIAFVLLASPHAADARAGSGGSFGSRGSHSWSAPPATRTAPYAAPLSRSTTPYANSYAGRNYGYRSGFGGGLLGGLLGFGLGSLLMGGGFGMASLFGLIIRIFLIVLLVRFVMRLFRGGATATGPGYGGFGGGPMGGGMGAGMGGFAGQGPTPADRPLAIQPADYQAFEQSLIAIQAAWTAQDVNALRNLVTPEMLGYFAEQLAGQASRGVRNTVTRVQLLQGDLAQAWAEPGREYATVAMRFSMIDATYDAAGRVVDGDPNEHVTVTEIWTFMRAPGGHWLLSAIQQAR